MEEYTCYFKSDTADKPAVLFLSAFIDELIIKLHFERINGVKNVIKTNESIEYINKNLNEHSDIIISFIANKIIYVDYKRSNLLERCISIKPLIFNFPKVGIGTIIKDNSSASVIINTPEILKEYIVKKGNLYAVSFDNLLKKPLYKEELPDDLYKKYKKLSTLYSKVPKYNNESLEEYSKVILKYLTPLFQEEFNLTPKICFI